jgi:hypothetical protein
MPRNARPLAQDAGKGVAFRRFRDLGALPRVQVETIDDRRLDPIPEDDWA